MASAEGVIRDPRTEMVDVVIARLSAVTIEEWLAGAKADWCHHMASSQHEFPAFCSTGRTAAPSEIGAEQKRIQMNRAAEQANHDPNKAPRIRPAPRKRERNVFQLAQRRRYCEDENS